MSDVFRLSSSEGSRYLELSSLRMPLHPIENGWCSFTATLVLEGLRATVDVDELEFRGLIKTFERIAKDWRGWKGSLAWESIEGDIGLEFTHDGLGHIPTLVSLRHHIAPEWSAEGVLTLEAGRLDSLSIEARSFFARPEN